MGLLNSLFGEGKEDKNDQDKGIEWLPLQSTVQIEALEQASYIRPQLIYKHSTSCGISSVVFRMFNKRYAFDGGRADLHFLDLRAFREVSNEVSDRFGIRHESPQLLIIKEGKAILNASHGAIPEINLAEVI